LRFEDGGIVVFGATWADGDYLGLYLCCSQQVLSEVEDVVGEGAP